MPREHADVEVDVNGLVVPSSMSGSIDVLLDGQRVWSFNPDRDGTGRNGHRRVEWPKVLVRHLDGVAEVSLVDHVTQQVLHASTVHFGDGDSRVRVVDGEGHPLAVDKGGRLQRDFSNTEDSARDEIMDALESVMHDLHEECGLDVYLMYGCLLGAIRDGHMIGHDSDADVAYLSRYTHPFDVIRECTAAIRHMKALGWKVVKMSGANFKVWVPLPDGRRCGIDVFGSFHVGDTFYVTGSLTGTLDRSALLPFGTVTLEGREVTAPAKPEEVLAFTYGPGWRVPDPAFHFDHDPADVQRMDAWFRAPRRRLRLWHDFYKSPDAAKVPREHSLFAQWAHERMAARGAGDAHVLDVGAGTGRDSVWFAAQGHRVTALDFSTVGMRETKALRKEADAPLHVRSMNLQDLRSVLVQGTRFSHREGTREVYARGLLDTLGPAGRDNFWRFASMVQRGGGETFVEFRTPHSRREAKHFGDRPREYVDPENVAAQVAPYGGTVVHLETGRGLAPLGSEDPHIARIVVRWTP